MEQGRHLTLPVWMIGEVGALLGNRHRNVLLPAEEVTPELAKGDRIKVFVTTDRDGEPVATLKGPAGVVGDLVMLEVVETDGWGAWCAWGVTPHLLVPHDAQQNRLKAGDKALVMITTDDQGRVCGVTRLVEVLSYDTAQARVGQKVDMRVYGFNDDGVLCVVNDQWSGQVYKDRVSRQIAIGDTLSGYIERIRDEGLIDLSMVPVGVEGTHHATKVVLEALRAAGGFLPLHDRSPPAEIKSALGLSKKAFKKAVGALYRNRRITLEDGGIRQT